MAELKLVFKDEINEDGEPGIAISLEDVEGGLDLAEKTEELTPAQMAALDIIQGLEFAADAVYSGDELISTNSIPKKEQH